MQESKQIQETECVSETKPVQDFRVALVGIIVERPEAVSSLNAILHEYGTFIIGRMGIPHQTRKINIISVVMDAPQEIISALSGKIGRLPGVTSRVIYSKV